MSFHFRIGSNQLKAFRLVGAVTLMIVIVFLRAFCQSAWSSRSEHVPSCHKLIIKHPDGWPILRNDVMLCAFYWLCRIESLRKSCCTGLSCQQHHNMIRLDLLLSLLCAQIKWNRLINLLYTHNSRSHSHSDVQKSLFRLSIPIAWLSGWSSSTQIRASVCCVDLRVRTAQPIQYLYNRVLLHEIHHVQTANAARTLYAVYSVPHFGIHAQTFRMLIGNSANVNEFIRCAVDIICGFISRLNSVNGVNEETGSCRK